MAEGQVSPKGIHIETRSGDPSAVAGASILASLSNHKKDISVLPPPGSNGENMQQGPETSTLPSAGDASESCIHDVDIAGETRKGPTENNEGDGISASDFAPNDTFHLNSIGLDARIDSEAGKLSGAKYELRPLLRMLAGSSAADLDLSGSILKVFDDQREATKDLDSQDGLPASRCQAFKDGLRQGILSPSDLQFSFDNFPYYLR